MKNDGYIEIMTYDNIIPVEIYFNYYDQEGKIVGDFTVNEFGQVKWHIRDVNYSKKINYALDYIIGSLNIRNLDDEIKNKDINRWNRAKIFIQQTGLFLNHKYVEEKKLFNK